MDTAAVVNVGSCEVLVGTCSWADASLVKDTQWYPRRTMTATERLAYYASRFPVVEVASTYRFPATPELSRSWVERTPDGFTIDVRAWSLLTGQPTFPDSLWADLRGDTLGEHRDKRRLYPTHLTPEAIEEVWVRFRHGLAPLQASQRLGVIRLAYPRWFGPNEVHREELTQAVERLTGMSTCVEFDNPGWLRDQECERTLELVEQLGATLVCVDPASTDATSAGPGPTTPVLAVTAELAVVRLGGPLAVRDDVDVPVLYGRRYRPDELAAWVPRIGELASSAVQVHVLFDNCHRDQAVTNAAELVALLLR